MTNLEKQQFLALVSEYSSVVKEAVGLLNAKSENSKGFQALDGEIHARAGYLDDSRKSIYEFHGAGCLITTEHLVVDFDFGEDRRCDGIDPGFLFYFVRYNKSMKDKYAAFTNWEQLNNFLQTLEKEGLFTRDLAPFIGHAPDLTNDRLFYLVATINDVDTPVWKPYRPEGWSADY